MTLVDTTPLNTPDEWPDVTVETADAIDGPWTGATWTPEPRLYVQSLNRVINGTDTATIIHRVGSGVRYPEDPTGDPLGPEPEGLYLNKYVRITTVNHFQVPGEQPEDPPVDKDEKFVWYGYIVSRQQFRGGAEVTQEYYADYLYQVVGLEYFMSRRQLTYSVIANVAQTGIEYVERAVPFNEAGDGSPFKATTVGRANRDPTVPWAFVNTDENPVLWSGKDIIQYLLVYMPATPVPIWRISQEGEYPEGEGDYLKDFYPTIRTENRTIMAVLNELCSLKRGLCWWLEYKPDPTGGAHSAVIRVNSVSPFDVPLGYAPAVGFGQLKQNYAFKDLRFDSQKDVVYCQVGVNQSREYDQVIMRGARRTSTCTLSYLANNLFPDWPSTLESEYYTGADPEDVEKNEAFRSLPKFEAVFQNFALTRSWDYKANDGSVGGSMSDVFPLFDIDGSILPGEVLQPSYIAMTFQKSLPFEVGVDYSTSANHFVTPNREGTDTDQGGTDYRRTYVIQQINTTQSPSDAQWCDATRMSNAEPTLGARSFPKNSGKYNSYTVSTSTQFPALTVKSRGENHTAAQGTWGTDAGKSDERAQVDWRNMRVTVCIEADAFCEAKYPKEPSGNPGLPDQILYIDAGPGYRTDYLVPETIIGLDENRQPVKAQGGLLRDDTVDLTAVAAIAYAWYSYPKAEMAVRFRQLRNFKRDSTDVLAGLELGDMVSSLSDAENVDTIISSIIYDFENGTTTLRTALQEEIPMA